VILCLRVTPTNARGMLSLIGSGKLTYVAVRLDARGDVDRLLAPHSYPSAHLDPA
jgi:hypothetical protein